MENIFSSLRQLLYHYLAIPLSLRTTYDMGDSGGAVYIYTKILWTIKPWAIRLPVLFDLQHYGDWDMTTSSNQQNKFGPCSTSERRCFVVVAVCLFCFGLVFVSVFILVWLNFVYFRILKHAFKSAFPADASYVSFCFSKWINKTALPVFLVVPNSCFWLSVSTKYSANLCSSVAN